MAGLPAAPQAPSRDPGGLSQCPLLCVLGGPTVRGPCWGPGHRHVRLSPGPRRSRRGRPQRGLHMGVSRDGGRVLGRREELLSSVITESAALRAAGPARPEAGDRVTCHVWAAGSSWCRPRGRCKKGMAGDGRPERVVMTPQPHSFLSSFSFWSRHIGVRGGEELFPGPCHSVPGQHLRRASCTQDSALRGAAHRGPGTR